MTRQKVLVLTGSAVDEFHADLSRVYARGFVDAFGDDDEYELVIASISPDGRWRFTADLTPPGIESARSLSAADALAHVVAENIDFMVPQMFCRPGMTTYRSAFDLIGVPFVGNTPEVMAATANKHTARAVVAAAGVAVPRGEVVRSADAEVGMPQRLLTELPVVVKPVDSDNSMGVELVHDRRELPAAIEGALRHSDAVLIESYIELGREVRCGILVRDGELVCLPLEEYAVDASKPIRGRADKLDRNTGGDLFLVAKDETRAWIVDPEDPVTAAVWDAARRCHVALGCRDYSLFDFRIDPDGTPWFLEAGLYCSFSPGSVISVMAAAAGISLAELFSVASNECEKRSPT